MASASDDFNRANGPIGSNWALAIAGIGVEVNSNKAVQTGFFGAGAIYTGVSWTNDHESTIVSGNGTNYHGPTVRMSVGPGDCYWYLNDGQIQKLVGGAATVLTTSTSFTTGDTATLRVTGNQLEWFKNGVSQGTLTDNSLTTGSPGLAFFSINGSIDSWSGADVVTDASVTGVFVSSGAALYAPTTTVGDVVIDSATINSTSILSAPTISEPGIDISGPTISAGTTSYAPTLTVGDVTVTGVLISASTTLYSPTAAQPSSTPLLAAVTLMLAP